MILASYGRLLRRPGVLRLVLLSLVARLPHAAVGVVLTLHVVVTLDLGYAHAGAVAAAITIGMALGGPWRGRRVDRLGLRRAVLPSVVVEAAVWATAPSLGFRGLVVAGVVAGLFMVPVFSVIRQSLSVLVPEREQRTAFALDSVTTELSFMLGPVLGVVVATTWSTTAALVLVGVATVGAGALLMWVDPPTRSTPSRSRAGDGAAQVVGGAGDGPGRDASSAAAARVVTPALLVTLLAASAASLVLTGTDVSIVASLEEWDRVAATGWMVALWAGGSVVGGVLYGAGSRSVRPLTLVLVLSLLTIPAALAGTPGLLAVAVVLAGLPCAPALSAINASLVRLVPEERRGEVMGWSGSAMTVGSALGAPVCGALIDRAGAGAGFLAVGAVGTAVAGVGLLVLRRTRPSSAARVPLAGTPAAEQAVGLGALDPAQDDLPTDVAPAEREARVPTAPLG
ncbi:MFS transporter [uncultured Cellulomonas sp.]|uniref:MFS transporter n=1 Tax=uncultured Cellulomonas sp. TaxID=189682 RepID=UPI00262D69B9|nr:MFS transporter [uncultured Cellulomonas sp.]